MSRKAISTNNAPTAIGPYSQAIAAGPWLALSGQIALDPETGEMVGGGVEAETKQVLDNLREVLAAGGAAFDDVIKTTLYLTDLGDFQKVNAIYNKCFSEARPARVTVEVAGLPKGAKVEIDAIAYLENQR